jgi:hypothetical protein
MNRMIKQETYITIRVPIVLHIIHPKDLYAAMNVTTNGKRFAYLTITFP